MKTIAYIAPEIPALSATFVYNEILALQKKGFTVRAFSVHVPQSEVSEDRFQGFTSDICYLYELGGMNFLQAAFHSLLTSPVSFCKTLTATLHDVFCVGLFTHTGRGLIYRFFAACRVNILLKKKKCEHIHAHFAHVPTDIAMYAAMLACIPFSFTSHANDLFERGWLLQEKINRAKFAATISEFNREYLTSIGCDHERIEIVRCGVDTSKFCPALTKPVIPVFQIGTVGRFVEKKGFDVLLYAALLLKEKGIDCFFTIAGCGPLEDRMSLLARKLGIDSIVSFPGALPHDDVARWLQQLDLFVLPCQQDLNGDQDGIPVVLMEAMASGIPVISTNISGIPELITNGNEGMLVKQKDPRLLADAVQTLFFDESLRERMIENGINKVKSEFEENVNIQRIVRLLTN